MHFCALCVWQNCGIYSEIVCGSMQRYANSMCYLVAPPVLSFGQYCYFDGFWLQIFSVQFTDCTDGSKGCYYKNIHSNTLSRPFGYLHSLDYPLTFYLCHLWQNNASNILLNWQASLSEKRKFTKSWIIRNGLRPIDLYARFQGSVTTL